MKFQFERDLDFQLAAIQSVCDLFRGQEVGRSEFSLTTAHPTRQARLGQETNEQGLGNRLNLTADALLSNLQDIQLRHGLPPTQHLESRDFTVEMETGTGKTYVYLRTIFELNRRYGFTKFAIVVPSIAIKEGVNKSIEMMSDHFRREYSGQPFEHFLYDSARLAQVRNFAASPQIQIMIVTVGAINKQEVNSIYQENEKTGGEKPIDLVQATRPILIVDEPQSVDGGLQGRGKAALDAMNPLCTLRYSATHVAKYNMVYRLNAVDAYQQKLVKQIEVAAGTVLDDYNTPYVRLMETRHHRGVINAKIEVDAENPAGHVTRRTITVQHGDDLERKTRRPIYANHYIGEITAGRNNESIELRIPGAERWLTKGQAHGGADHLAVQRAMIRKTIQEHLEKEKRLHPLGIKTLTLFFIDQVSRYRTYDQDGNPAKGDYAKIFEQEYRRAAQRPEHKSLFDGIDLDAAAEQAHNGYFSADRRNRWTDTAENNQANRENAERAYSLIMRDKEKLLSLDEPLKFIFSHSALREGWDNPNVFQICALREIQTEQERRQTIGRGLRLCVNQSGERQRGFELNTLTVIAREGYQEFADHLQREIEAETGIRFGTIAPHQFAPIPVKPTNGQSTPLGAEKSQILWHHLAVQGYINGQGKIDDSLRQALADGSLALSYEFEPLREAITQVLRQAAGRIEIKNAAERRRLQPREATLNSEEFKSLWDSVKHQTTYRVNFDYAKLISDCANALRDAPPIPPARLQWQTANIEIGEAGATAMLREATPTMPLANDALELPDLLTELQNRTQLTRRSIQQILSPNERLDDFRNNPQKFIETAAEIINRRKRLALVAGIKYQRLGDDYYYAQELFAEKELTGYLKQMLAVKKSVYDHVIYDAANEANFAKQLETNTAVKVYAKLPGWFQVPTPLGPYNPDWAVLIENENGERLYFVAETKGSSHPDDLRELERAKTECGKAHFGALQAGESPVRYRVVPDLNGLLAEIQ